LVFDSATKNGHRLGKLNVVVSVCQLYVAKPKMQAIAENFG
jgi:hypothetical protein